MPVLSHYLPFTFQDIFFGSSCVSSWFGNCLLLTFKDILRLYVFIDTSLSSFRIAIFLHNSQGALPLDAVRLS